jgi:lactate permease
MPSLDPIMAALPLGLLVFWMTKERALPSNRALPLAALVLYSLLLGYFRMRPVVVHAAVMEGLLTALTPILIVWGAILLFKTMELSGATATVRAWLNGITSNRVAQLMIIGWSFSFLIEGVSGFGTPAALAAPLLVGLGFAPIKVAVLCLIMNTMPVSFGAVGMPTWFGLGGLHPSPDELREIAFKTALIHAGAALAIPLLALRVVVSAREIRENIGFIAIVVAATMVPYVAVARFSVEFPSIAGGVCGLAASVSLARRGFGLASADTQPHTPQISTARLLKATFPQWATVLTLLFTRLDSLGLKSWLTSSEPAAYLPLGRLGELSISPSLVIQWQHIFGTNQNWSHAVLYVPSVIPFFLVSSLAFALHRTPMTTVRIAWRQSFQQVLGPIGAFLGALVLVKLLMAGGERSCAASLGHGLARMGGGAWQFGAVYLGAFGSFFSGSNTVSNLTFGGIQDATAATLGLSRTTILSLQSAGGAMGNMVCIHNIVAVCSILGLQSEEGRILRQTFLPVLLYGAIAGAVSLAF